MSKSKGKNGKAVPDSPDNLSPRWREAVAEFETLRNVLASGEPPDQHFRVDVVVPGAGFAELLDALRLERGRLGVTLAELSRRTGIDESDLSRLENGQTTDPHVSALTRYAEGLGKRLSWTLVAAEGTPDA